MKDSNFGSNHYRPNTDSSISGGFVNQATFLGTVVVGTAVLTYLATKYEGSMKEVFTWALGKPHRRKSRKRHNKRLKRDSPNKKERKSRNKEKLKKNNYRSLERVEETKNNTRRNNLHVERDMHYITEESTIEHESSI
jgi:spore germination cell wall hydrolase CwlJ-like protein